MAVDLRSLARVPHVREIVLGAANTVTVVLLGDTERTTIRLRPRGGAARLLTDAALLDGGPVGTADYVTLDANTWFPPWGALSLSGGIPGRLGSERLCLTATAGGRIVEAIVETARGGQ